ncbi:hypothetical protein ACHHYP_01692 [Achlya hypogyna]|uniref:J domain-containing protein n=1 Tax=Achlya hypogyna TaxID=1202772 RepID=A0A1V9Z882_ACHHY|nr:hypothetical protein ACHHYP_01692 [Achlya hypogyna]
MGKAAALAVVAVVAAMAAGFWHAGVLESYYIALLYNDAADASHYEVRPPMPCVGQCPVLQVSTTASVGDITSAYRALSRKYHPDKTKALSPATRDAFVQKFYRITLAYETLSDSERRREYDMAKLRRQQQLRIDPSQTWHSWLWQCVSLETVGYVVAMLGLLTVACDYVFVPMRRLYMAHTRTPSSAHVQQKGTGLYEARVRLQAQYDEQAEQARRQQQRRRLARVS